MIVTPGTHVQHRNGQTGVITGPHGGDHSGSQPVFTCRDPDCYDVLLDGSTVHVPWHRDELVPLAAWMEERPKSPLAFLQAPCPPLACAHIMRMIKTSELRVRRVSMEREAPPTIAEVLMAITDLRHAADELQVELIEKVLGVAAT